MKGEHHDWLDYAEENLAIARLALESGYYNACLQNVQQAVEKFMKADRSPQCICIVLPDSFRTRQMPVTAPAFSHLPPQLHEIHAGFLPGARHGYLERVFDSRRACPEN